MSWWTEYGADSLFHLEGFMYILSNSASPKICEFPIDVKLQRHYSSSFSVKLYTLNWHVVFIFWKWKYLQVEHPFGFSIKILLSFTENIWYISGLMHKYISPHLFRLMSLLTQSSVGSISTPLGRNKRLKLVQHELKAAEQESWHEAAAAESS